MFECFLSQLLVLLLLFINCFRIFMIKHSKIDSAAVLAPIAFIISIANIFIWGLSSYNFFLSILSIFITATNLRALIRLSAKLYVDRYSGLFVIFTFLELCIVIFASILIFKDSPVKIESSRFNVEKKSYRLTGNMSRGFSILRESDFFKLSAGKLYVYKNNTEQFNLPSVIICGNDTAEIIDYEPYILFLSQRGFNVYAADFYSNDCKYLEDWKNNRVFRKFYSRLISKTKKTDSELLQYKLNQINSYKALYNLTVQDRENSVFFIFDNLDYDSIYEILENTNGNCIGFYSLNKLNEYKTSSLGFVEQTDVREAKKHNLTKDKTLFIPRYCAGKTISEINALLPPQNQ